MTETIAAAVGGPSVLPEPVPGEIRLEAVLHAFADPVRLRIVTELAVRQHEMTCQAFGLPVSKSTSTHHFKVLREAGVIRQFRKGTARMSELRRAELDELFPGLLDGVLNGVLAQRARTADCPDGAAGQQAG
ncbi:ArsR/SmtB family transcription factor [Kitasatospora sp. NPDC056138]|uniref:ArsR/SmtB family transcription factor n=1 Tax=Kitasatospora sp. NPDC056138 TaxID=3345724 RepID=UPI0035E06A35